MGFVNPYTFIPLGSFKTPHQAGGKAGVEDGALYTGVIPCVLETKTRLVMPEHSDDKTWLPFFKLKKNGRHVPVIPGSSIRGVIRSTYESLTDSCMRANKDHERRMHSSSGLKEAGLLCYEGGKYVLYEAERHKVWDEPIVASCVTGQVVDFLWDEPVNLGGSNRDHTNVVTHVVNIINEPSVTDALTPASAAAADRGVFLRVNRLNGSHPSVFAYSGEVIDDDVAEKYVDALEENIDMYCSNNLGNLATDYKACFELMKEGKCALPVWYGQQEDQNEAHYQFSWAAVSRAVYPKTVEDFYAEAGLRACPREGRVCPACALFGFVSQDGDGCAHAGRVRFSDAVYDSGKLYGSHQQKLSTVWLPELLNPRVSSFEFYLRNDNDEFRRSFTPEDPDTRLAGRKAFWHHSAGTEAVSRTGGAIMTKTGEVLNAQAEYVPGGVSFKFDVYVDGVTKLQLHQLLYALTFGEYLDDGNRGGASFHCHKIGRAKPYGYGSVHITVQTDSIVLRSVSTGSYDVSYGLATCAMTRPEVEKSLKHVVAVTNVARFANLPPRIHYPRVTASEPKESKIFEWFGKNRECFDVDEGVLFYHHVLPSSEDSIDAQELPYRPDKE